MGQSGRNQDARGKTKTRAGLQKDTEGLQAGIIAGQSRRRRSDCQAPRTNVSADHFGEYGMRISEQQVQSSGIDLNNPDALRQLGFVIEKEAE